MSERGRHESGAVDGEHEPGAVDEEESPGREVDVHAHESRPGRIVFTESGNTDGWIATDLAVEPEP